MNKLTELQKYSAKIEIMVTGFSFFDSILDPTII